MPIGKTLDDDASKFFLDRDQGIGGIYGGPAFGLFLSQGQIALADAMVKLYGFLFEAIMSARMQTAESFLAFEIK